MMRQFSTISWRGKGVLLLLIIFLAVVAILSGCGKEKISKPKVINRDGTCDVLADRPSDMRKPVEVNYENKVKLIGVTVDRMSQNQLRVIYYWQPMEDLGAYNQVFVHFTDTMNHLLFQNDHPLCLKKSFSELMGKFVKESYVVSIPEPAIGKKGYLKIGIYAFELQSAPRLKINSSIGISKDDGDTSAIIEKVNF